MSYISFLVMRRMGKGQKFLDPYAHRPESTLNNSVPMPAGHYARPAIGLYYLVAF